MSAVLHVSLQGDLSSLSKKVPDSSRIVANAARGVSNLLIRHLLARDGKAAHRSGFPRSGYWGAAARSVQTSVEGSEAVVSIHAPGIRLHYKGGVVRPAEAQRLAIPIDPSVAGKRPKEVIDRSFGPSPFFIKSFKGKQGQAYIVRKEPDGRLKLYWLLLSSATHRPDSTVLPPVEDLRSAALRAAALVPK